MGNGILLCGLNGAGKSTLGKALAEKLQYYFIDNEDLYFPRENPRDPYASPRSRKEVEGLLLQEITAHGNFVFTSVRGDYEILSSCLGYAVLLHVPRELRLQRIRDRSFHRFGGRIAPGGDLYDREERFFAFAAARAENFVEAWAQTLSCPVIRADGTRPVEENINFIIKEISHD